MLKPPDELRKWFDEIIRTQNYRVGKALIVAEQQRIIPNVTTFSLLGQEDRKKYAHLWVFELRQAYIFGDIKLLADRLVKDGEMISSVLPLEVGYLKCLEGYANGKYEVCEAKLMELLTPPPNPQDEEYVLVRLHMLAAKCAWRNEALPRAILHLAYGTTNLEAYLSRLPSSAQNSFLRARLLTIHARLLIERRQPASGEEYNQDAITLLRLAESILSGGKNVKVDEDLPENSHLFLAEVYELMAMNARNKALANKTQEGYETAISAFEESDAWLDKTFAIVRRYFPNRDSRREAHAYRIRGYNYLSRVLLTVRRNLLVGRRQEWCRAALTEFEHEYLIRKAHFGYEQHETIIRVYNNQALAYLLSAQGYLRKETGSPSEEQEKLARAALDLAKAATAKACQVNKLNVDAMRSAKSSISSAWNVESIRQAFHSINSFVEIELRLNDLSPNHSVSEVYDKVLGLVRIGNSLEREYQSGRTSSEAFQNISRRTRPFYEGLLEVSWLVRDHPDFLPGGERHVEWKDRIINVYHASLAPGIERDTGGMNLLYRKYTNLREQITRVLKQLSSATFGMAVERLLPFVHCHSILQERVNSPTTTPSSIPPSLKDLVEGFTGVPGGMIIFFIGHRHIYQICFRSLKKGNPSNFRLYQLTPEAPYAGIVNLRARQQRINNQLTYVQRNKEVFTSGRQELKRMLQEQFEVLIQPALRAAPGVIRWYVFPDRWLWHCSWSLLNYGLEDGIENTFKAKKGITLTQHVNPVSLYHQAFQGRFAPVEDTLPFSHLILPMAGNHGTNEFERAAQDIHQAIDDRLITPPRLLRGQRQLHGTPDAPSIRSLELEEIIQLLGQAEFIYMLGHSTRRMNGQRLDFILKFAPDDDKCIYLTQEQIASLDLSNCKLIMLMMCESGGGTSRAGFPPESLATACIATGARAVIFSSHNLELSAARAFSRIFLDHCLTKRGKTFGEAYGLTIQEMLHNYYWRETEHSLAFTGINIIGNQMDRLLY